MILSGYAYPASEGDTFDGIALLQYGDEKYAAEIMAANPELTNKMVLNAGDMVFLPVVEVPPETEETDYAPYTAPWKEN